jgi:hypothetical protein
VVRGVWRRSEFIDGAIIPCQPSAKLARWGPQSQAEDVLTSAAESR